MAGRGKNTPGSRYKRNSERRRTLISMRESKGTALPSFLEMEREEDVLDALEAIEADVMLGRSVRWNKLLPVIRGMRVRDQTAPDCLNVAKALLGLFERYHCRDISVLSEVFQLLLSLTEPYDPFLSSPIEFTQIFFCPYGEEQTNTDLVFSAARCGNPSLLKLQLKFGLGMGMPYSSSLSNYIDILVAGWPINSDDDTKEDYETSIDNPRVIIPLLAGIKVKEIGKNIRRNFNPESMKRLSLVLRMVDLVRATKICLPDCRENFAECYRLLFESLPEPLVTSVEVTAFLEKCLPVSGSPFISAITEDFKNLLPELAEVPQPRSLKHLCRIQVRQNLRRNLNLPHGVASLPLPTNLKDYIMLNDDGDYSVIIRTPLFRVWRGDIYSMPDKYINTPERDDCVTSFLKNL